MELTKPERLILYNQYLILQELDVLQGTEPRPSYEEYKAILSNGFTYSYSMFDRWIDDEVPLAKQELVMDILSTYREIEMYKRDHPEDHEVIDHVNGIFGGFDDNNERDYLSFLCFVVGKQNLFTEQLAYMKTTNNFNAHVRMVETYRSMVSVFKSFKHYTKTREQILQILNAN